MSVGVSTRQVCVCQCVYTWTMCVTNGWGRSQQPHCRACNPSLPPSDGDEEIMRPSSALCVCVCVCLLGVRSNESPLHPLTWTVASASAHLLSNSSR